MKRSKWKTKVEIKRNSMKKKNQATNLVILFFMVSSSVLSSLSGAAVVGLSGSRVPLSPAVSALSSFLSVVPLAGVSVGVGCARGVDASVRSAFPGASVFSVSPPLSRGAFAARSFRLVSWVSARRGVLCVFPGSSCPAGVAPRRSFRGCLRTFAQ